ncbi:hypothetical protein QYE76_059474 [Lolium multiflorum]|uniref:Uncharacterized protein n=1 Tax=Lolium multiflorum TaxID=4521 RepID=A0AAD8RX84_LOLMU|nr:hypothetical protein QYE76_059474 [Lolium multiflorum]
MKKQSLMLMEQSRKSSEREKAALQQAQDAITEKDAAVAEAAAATSRENFMLELLTDASLDMADSTLAGIPVVALHHISPPSTFNVLLGSSWFD